MESTIEQTRPLIVLSQEQLCQIVEENARLYMNGSSLPPNTTVIGIKNIAKVLNCTPYIALKKLKTYLRASVIRPGNRYKSYIVDGPKMLILEQRHQDALSGRI